MVKLVLETSPEFQQGWVCLWGTVTGCPLGLSWLRVWETKRKRLGKYEFYLSPWLSIWLWEVMEVSPVDPSGWVWSPLYSQMPRHVTSNLQRVREEMDINRGRQPSQSTWEEPCDPRPTDSLPWTIATPSYSPGSRDVCQLQGHWAHACCWAELLAGCPQCRGTAGSERPRLRLPPPARLRHSLLALCCSLNVSTWGARKRGVGEPEADKENKEDKEGLKSIYYMPSSAQDTDKHHYLYSLYGKRDIIY